MGFRREGGASDFWDDYSSKLARSEDDKAERLMKQWRGEKNDIR